MECFELRLAETPKRSARKGSFIKNGRKKYLNSFEVKEIVNLYPDMFNYELAKAFNVSESTILKVKRTYNLSKSKKIMDAARFKPKHKPFNKDLPMIKWMDGRKIKKVMKCLKLGRVKGNRDKLHELNRIPIVGIKDGKLYPFESSVNAARILKAKGVKVNARNIRAVCSEIVSIVGGREYIRRHAGGFRWFVASEVEKYKEFLR